MAAPGPARRQLQRARFGDSREPVRCLACQRRAGRPGQQRLADAARRSEPARAGPRASGACAATRVDARESRAGTTRVALVGSGASARLALASITDSGVRSSCDASAVKSSCRWRARSMGMATRRPISTAPTKTRQQQDRRDQELAQDDGRARAVVRRAPATGRRRRGRCPTGVPATRNRRRRSMVAVTGVDDVVELGAAARDRADRVVTDPFDGDQP